MRKWLSLLLGILLICVPLQGFAQEESTGNLLTNSDFESMVDGIPADWSISGYQWPDDQVSVSVSTQAYTGNSAILLAVQSDNDIRLEQTVTVQPNSYYRLGGFVRIDQPFAKGGANISVAGSSASFQSVADTEGEWRQYVTYGQTGPDQTALTVYVRIGMYGSTATGIACFDQITLQKIDKIPAGNQVISYQDSTKQETNAPAKSERSWLEDFVGVKGMVFLCMLLIVITALIYLAFLHKPIAISAKMNKQLFWWAMALAFVLRLVIAYNIAGHADQQLFYEWGTKLLDIGPGKFYSQVGCDYPPGYLYILGGIGQITRFYGQGYGTAGGHLIIKLPAIICDMVAGYMIYRIAHKRFNQNIALGLAMLCWFNIATMTDSAIWGQVDMVMLLPVLGMLMLIENKKLTGACLLFTVGVLSKPQVLMITPILMYAFIWEFYQGVKTREKDGGARLSAAWKSLGIGACASIALFVLVILPFCLGRPWTFIIEKYMTTMSSYPYASVNAFNLFTLLRGNFVDQGQKLFFFLSYADWGNIAILWAVAGSAIAYFWRCRQGRRPNAYLITAFIFATMFVLGVRMHERYLFAVIPLLIAAFAHEGDRRHLWLATGFGVTFIANLVLVLIDSRLTEYTTLTFVFSAANVALYIYLVHVLFDNCIRGKFDFVEVKVMEEASMDASHAESIDESKKAPNNAPQDADLQSQTGDYRMHHRKDRQKRVLDRLLHYQKPERWVIGKRDWIIMGALILSYSILAFYNLGDMSAPEHYWQPRSTNEKIQIDLGSEVELDSIWQYFGIGEAYLYYETSLDGITWEYVQRTETKDNQTQTYDFYDYRYGHMYTWQVIDCKRTVRYIKLSTQHLHRDGFRMLELAFKDSEGHVLPFAKMDVYNRYTVIASYTPADIAQKPGWAQLHALDGFSIAQNALDLTAGLPLLKVPGRDTTALFDEQYSVPERPSYLNGMYFDEIYHARTAYEHLYQIHPYYETTHPPLGKVLIMAGISIFGMNPFGWRIVGTLVGIFMIPAMYFLAKRLFKRTRWAALATLLMTFDCMHFAQTRIATIDSYAVLFIILMYYFMYRYFQMNLLREKVGKTLVPLALSGLFFGIGAASKWICIYAGAGLAVIFFWSIGRRVYEAVLARRALEREPDTYTDEEKAILMKASRELAYKLLFTLSACILLFIVIPFGIYYASFIPIFMTPGYKTDQFWGFQTFMYDYHSDLTATHAFGSAWHQWPLIQKPIWYFMGTRLPANTVSSIASFGNPVVWWSGFAAVVYWIGTLFSRPKEKTLAILLLIGLASQLLPWVIVTRTTFIYHYFASVPFIILLTVLALKRLCKKDKAYEIPALILAIAAVAVFLFFLPALNGAVISDSYARLLAWLPGWTFFAWPR